jgi:hypothetical protein
MRGPNTQTMVVVPVQLTVSSIGLASTSVAPGGSTSVTEGAGSVEGPLLVTISVYSMFDAVGTGSEGPSFVRARSAVLPGVTTVAVALAVLSAGFNSGVGDETLAVFVNGPGVDGAVIVM